MIKDHNYCWGVGREGGGVYLMPQMWKVYFYICIFKYYNMMDEMLFLKGFHHLLWFRNQCDWGEKKNKNKKDKRNLSFVSIIIVIIIIYLFFVHLNKESGGLWTQSYAVREI